MHIKNYEINNVSGTTGKSNIDRWWLSRQIMGQRVSDKLQESLANAR